MVSASTAEGRLSGIFRYSWLLHLQRTISEDCTLKLYADRILASIICYLGKDSRLSGPAYQEVGCTKLLLPDIHFRKGTTNRERPLGRFRGGSCLGYSWVSIKLLIYATITKYYFRGKEKLTDRLAIRPTSETAMYPYYAKKIRSHRDLPLRLNQWNNVVRWEFKHAMPFLRSREFLWQEGHTAHLTQQGAGEEVRQILHHYAAIYEELLAVPVVKGTKTENEKFAGALYTETIEGYIGTTGRGIQAGTSHCLGQHFSKMFKITVEDPSSKEGDEKKPPLHVWQNSWGFSTRSIGVMVLVHGDDKGLVVPPRVAEVQVVIIPVGITAKTTPEDKERLYGEVQGFKAILEDVGVRAETDMREGYSPGWKFNEWELKGVPLRIEFGPKDSEKHVVSTARRDTGEKSTIPITSLKDDVPVLLETIQADMFRKAHDDYKAHRVQVNEWDSFVPTLNAKNVILIRHCLGNKCEDQIKDLSKRTSTGDDLSEDARAPSMGAKSLCIPFEQPEGIVEGETKCTNPKCDQLAKKWVMFGRSY